jgi:hypothetical protein
MSVTYAGNASPRSSLQLFRDCLRMVNHVAGKSPKGLRLRQIVRGEFKRNALITDNLKIEALKANAIRALSNYLMMESSASDKKFKQKSDVFKLKEVDTIRRK